MKRGVAAVLFVQALCALAVEPPVEPSRQTAHPDSASEGLPEAASESAKRADARYDEMLNKMQAAVEEIAQLYGNPQFLQVFTNDVDRANELKQILKSARGGDGVRRELRELEKRREDLLSDIALREKEASRLTERLVRQRAALDALAAAVEQARKAVEETAK